MKNLSKFSLIHNIVFILLFTWPVIAISQQRQTGRDQFVALPARSLRLDSLSIWVERESGFVFSFNSGEINPGEKITFLNTKMKLSLLLLFLQEHYRLTHKIIGNHIIFYNDSSPKRKTQVISQNRESYSPQKTIGISDNEKAAGTPFGKEAEPLGITILPYAGTGISFKITPLILPHKAGKYLIKQDFTPQSKSVVSTSYPEREPFELFNEHDGTEKPNVSGTRFSRGSKSFCVSAGLTANEVLYINPQLEAGLPWLFALAAWGTNFKASGFFYGLGTSIKLHDGWTLQLSALSGVLSKDFKWRAFTSDSVIRIKTRLTRINLLGERQIGNRWSLRFGPVFNLMKNNYSLNGRPLANSLSSGKNYYILHPPYTIGKSNHDETDADKKLWIGIHIGLFYRLR